MEKYQEGAMFKTHVKKLIGKRMSQTGETLTQQMIEEATGIPQPTLSRWYKGEISRLEYDTVERLMRFFGCEFGELVTVELSSEG
jgi:hypothetical protein